MAAKSNKAFIPFAKFLIYNKKDTKYFQFLPTKVKFVPNRRKDKMKLLKKVFTFKDKLVNNFF